MSIREILTGTDNPALALKAAQVTAFGSGSLAEEVIKDLGETMLAREGLGLAAPQIGHALAIAVIGIPNADNKVTEYFPIINPRIIRFSGRELDYEECLSLPGVSLMVPRWTTITVKFQDINGRVQREKLIGFEARVWQHEIDHLNGILITDRAVPAEATHGG